MKILYLNVAMLAFVLSTTSVIADSSSYYQLFYQYGQQLQPVWNNFYNNFKPYQTIPEEKCSVFPGLSVVSDCDVRYLAGQMHRFSGPGKSSASNTDKPSGPSTTKAPKQVTVSTAIPSTTSTVAPTTTPAGPVCSNPALCQFPTVWAGYWFQSGMNRPLQIDRNSISTKGRCIESSGDKFYIEEKKDKGYLCVVMHEKHPNVLQYKEAFSDSREPLETLCGHISGDAPLYSMFRVGATPVPCPIKGPFQFTYYRGDNRECKSPPSSIDSCTEDWRLLLRFQACPDVIGSESTVEELVCLATWKEGSMRYFVGKLEHKIATSDEDKYRCFAYEKNKDTDHVGFQLAQSGDATCNGLANIEGSRTLKLTKSSHPTGSCSFPSWMTQAHQWHTLDWRKTYSFGHKNSSLRVSNASDVVEMSAVCSEVVATTDRTMTVLAYVTKGCKIGYVCMTFYLRSQHVIELQMSNFASNKEEACTPQFFDKQSSGFVTLITSSPKARQCPDLGKYNLLKDRKRNNRDACQEFTSLRMGCNRVDTLEFERDCPSDRKVESYECHASWEENGTSFLITSVKGTRTRFCFVYTESEKIFQFSSVQDSCRRNIQPGVGGIMAFNVTSNGQCAELSDSGSKRTSESSTLIYILSALTLMATLHSQFSR